MVKDEISILIYYTDTLDSNSKPILVLRKLSVKEGIPFLDQLNIYLTRDIVYGNLPYKFSDIENSLAISNDYSFALSSYTEKTETSNSHLIISFFSIYNDDKTIDTYNFNIPIKDLYNIDYKNGLQAFGYKNSYGIRITYFKNGEYSSGLILFGYGNTTDTEPINDLFDQYNSYKIKIRDYYKGIENNIFVLSHSDFF